MTRELHLRSFDMPLLSKFGVGFDSMFDEIMRISAQQGQQNYPPYNIIKVNDNRYTVEIAVAGFGEGDIDIEVRDNQLVVRGEKNSAGDEPEYLHRGISSRTFIRSFALGDHVEVRSAVQENGILSIDLEREVPEDAKPKAVAITYKK